MRQGCSWSEILYSLAIEPFLIKLRNDLKGISVPNCNDTFYLSAYAHDIILMISDQKDVDTLFNVCKVFKTVSSARINWCKSDAFSVRKWEEGLPNLPGGLVWKKDGLEYLGFFLGDKNFVQKNWEDEWA